MNNVTITLANSAYFQQGDYITVSNMTPRLPYWVMRKPWQDGDQAIVRWFYKLVGWKLPTGFRARVKSVNSQTELTLN